MSRGIAFKSCLITGATGFIGGRLFEVLKLDGTAQVKVLCRDPRKLSGVMRFAPPVFVGALDDEAVLAEAMRGCDVVFHCAHDFADAKSNLRAIEAFIAAAAKSPIKRFVYLSSAAVYPAVPGELEESSRPTPPAWEYAQNKLAAEDRLLAPDAIAALSPVILQPTTVYGPYSPHSLNLFRDLKQNRMLVPLAGRGILNPVYVDDLVRAMLLAADTPAAMGERFLISGPAPATWKEYLDGYEHILGVRTVRYANSETVERLQRPGWRKELFSTLKDPRRLLRFGAVFRFKEFLRARLPAGVTAALKKKVPLPLAVPVAGASDYYTAQATVHSGKARRLLHYEPRFTLARGMERLAQFAKWADVV